MDSLSKGVLAQVSGAIARDFPPGLSPHREKVTGIWQVDKASFLWNDKIGLLREHLTLTLTLCKLYF